VITNIYNKKTEGPTLMELFTATAKLKKVFWQLEMFDVCRVTSGAHIEPLELSKKKSIFLWLWKIPLRWALWFSCYKCLWSRRTLWNALYNFISFGAVWLYVFALENKHRLKEQATE
jgi:hypothetical protein